MVKTVQIFFAITFLAALMTFYFIYCLTNHTSTISYNSTTAWLKWNVGISGRNSFFFASTLESVKKHSAENLNTTGRPLVAAVRIVPEICWMTSDKQQSQDIQNNNSFSLNISIILMSITSSQKLSTGFRESHKCHNVNNPMVGFNSH